MEMERMAGLPILYVKPLAAGIVPGGLPTPLDDTLYNYTNRWPAIFTIIAVAQNLSISIMKCTMSV